METKNFIAFADQSKKVAEGSLPAVAEKSKAYLLAHPDAGVIVFDALTSQQVEIDFRGTPEAVRKRIEKTESPGSFSSDDAETRGGPGRPKLGVVSKEVTLLPQHWNWLSEQTGGASVTLRKLVDASMKKNAGRDSLRRAQESAYRFLLVTAGDRENYEEVLRALYAQDQTKFKRLMSTWPKDVRDHAFALAWSKAST